MIASIHQHQHQKLPTPPDSPPSTSSNLPSTSTSGSMTMPTSSPELEQPQPTTTARRTPSFHLILPLPRPASNPLPPTSTTAALLSSLYPPTSAEAQAHAHIHEHILHDPHIGAREMGLSATYAAVQRYLEGEDLFIFPRDGRELGDVLGRFARDVIFSLISQAKTRIEEGGYTRARSIALRSLKDRVLTPSNIRTLLDVHAHAINSIGSSISGAPELTPSLSRESTASVASSVSSEDDEVRTPPAQERERRGLGMTRIRDGEKHSETDTGAADRQREVTIAGA